MEDAFRALKHTLDLRPLYHRVEERIRAHVVLCWLAMLLVRIIERPTQTTTDLQRLFTALRIPEPPPILAITPARGRARALQVHA